MSPSSVHLALAGYSAGALAFGAFAAQLLLRRSPSAPARTLLAAALLTALWEGTAVLAVAATIPGVWFANQLLDCARYGAWASFILAILPHREGGDSERLALARRLGGPAVAVALAIAWGGGTAWLRIDRGSGSAALALALGTALGAAILGLMLCELLYRSTPEIRRWGIKPVCIGLGCAFAFDLYLFADALLLRALDPDLLGARGFVHALAVPLLMVASARNRDWTIDVAVSRRIVLGSTALLLSGGYLLLVAGVGYLVRWFGGQWGATVQAAFLSAALLGLVLLFTSGTVRSRLRVWISKNFFSYRYDYRQEWLRFTQVLSEPGDLAQPVGRRAIEALGELVESPGGLLFWRDRQEGRTDLRVSDARNHPAIDAHEPADGALAGFMERTGWVLELEDVRRRPARYDDIVLPEWVKLVPEAWILVPLKAQSRLAGFVVLLRPRSPVELDWEVLDLLKTAALQAAAFLGHVQATEALVQARQFDAFNRMSAFLVHDLKNLVAQQSLLLKNAERHGGNPEFQRDMVDTVRHVVERMNRLLLQLRSGAVPVTHAAPVDVEAVARRLASYHASRRQEVVVCCDSLSTRALAHEDRLERVLGHLIQNGFEATETGESPVEVRIRIAGERLLIEIEDHGKGMTEQFIRDGLFKPFVSSKATGMGIGAYESREYLHEIGGSMEVTSRPGSGTVFRILLPAAADARPEATRQEAA